MIEIIYDYLLHTFAIIGVMLLLVLVVTGYVLYKDEKEDKQNND